MTTDSARLPVLRTQLDLTWSLLEYHLGDLTDEDCRWEPARHCWTVRQTPAGRWVADWAESEPDPVPTTTLGWLTWHLGFWWTMVHDHSFGDHRLTRTDIDWPGSAAAAIDWIRECHRRWVEGLDSLTDAALDSSEFGTWPYGEGQPFVRTVAWVNLELMKNTAEIGQLRMLRRALGVDGGSLSASG